MAEEPELDREDTPAFWRRGSSERDGGDGALAVDLSCLFGF